MLGMGGMAVVYKAEDAILGRCVALKTLHRRYAEEVTFRARFKQEARVMASLDHENIVKVYDISQEGEIPFIVAEYIGGRDVGEMLKGTPGGRLGERSTRGVVGQLLEALDYAHRRGVVHCDIKPSNILITQDGTVKVADFGIARIVEDEEEPGEIIGSARYMSPEQLKGEETTPRSDLYSVGILLYHCLTGRPPFSGDTRSVARQQIYENPIPPRELNKGISVRLEAVILKALAKDPEDRYHSASAMLEDLRRGGAFAGVFTQSSGRTARSRKKRRRRGRGKALLASSMLTLLLLGAGTATAVLGYLDLGDLSLSRRVEETLTTPPQPVAEVPPEILPEVAQQEEEPEPSTEPEDSSQAVELALVPTVDAYFDYVAAEILQNSGFQTKVVYGYREGYAPTGVAWGTDPVVGTLAPLGSTVTVYATPKDRPQIVQPQVQPQPQNVQPQPPPVQPQPQPQNVQPQPQPQPPVQPQPQPPLIQPQIQPQI